ncbi:TonB-dependent siderophore receptor [Asticcacaulis sp.]|uniref:TonB-dependent receptor plug domain-containing protein n=1 Tax=Asticcacaulis sp. TaxID=1872648 RepID=UPI002618EEF6|nr:TonB-dependent receptor [Asticcacaulis sp.]
MRFPKALMCATALVCGLPVIAQAQTADAPASRQVIPYDQAFFSAFQVQSALDMVNRVPGFTLKNVDQVRGFAAAAGNVLIDGQRPTSKSDSLNDILNRIPAGTVERIDLIIGGAEGIDMQGQTQVVNIIRKASAKPTLTVIANARFLSNGWVKPTGRITYSRNAGDKTLELSATVFNSFDEEASPGDKTVYPANGSPPRRTQILSEAGGKGVELNAIASHPLWGGKLTVNGKWTPDTYTGNYRFITDTTAVENLDYSEDLREGGFQYVRPLGKAFTLKLNGLAKYTHEEGDDLYISPSEETRFREDSVETENIVSGQLIWTRSERLTYEVGLEKAYNSRDSDTGLTVNGAAVDLPASRVKVEEDRTEASFLATWRATPALSVETGLKYEWSTLSQTSERPDEKRFGYAKPKVQVTWSPKGPWQYLLRVERVLGQLDFDDFVSSIDLMDSTVKAGNVSLEPDKRWETELNASYRFGDKGALVLKFIHKDVSDVIDRVPIVAADGSVFDAKGNIGDGTAEEIGATLTLPMDRFRIPGGLLKFNGSVFLSEVTDPVTKEKRRLSRQTETDWLLEFSQDLPVRRTQWGFSVWNGYDEKVYRASEISYARGSAKLNLFAEYKPTPKLLWRVELNNLPGRVYDYDRVRYDGDRATGTVRALELTRNRSKPWLFIRVRKEL